MLDIPLIAVSSSIGGGGQGEQGSVLFGIFRGNNYTRLLLEPDLYMIIGTSHIYDKIKPELYFTNSPFVQYYVHLDSCPTRVVDYLFFSNH